MTAIGTEYGIQRCNIICCRLLVIAEAELPSTSEFGSSASTLRTTKQTLYVFEGMESQYNVPPIGLDLKQTVVLRTELFNAGVECVATYSKGTTVMTWCISNTTRFSVIGSRRPCVFF